MKYTHIITGLGLILKAQHFHENAARRYSDLFQEESAKHGHSLDYTNLQVFYQNLAQRHQCSLYYFQQAEVRYRDLVDLLVIDAQPGLEPGNDAGERLRDFM